MRSFKSGGYPGVRVQIGQLPAAEPALHEQNAFSSDKIKMRISRKTNDWYKRSSCNTGMKSDISKKLMSLKDPHQNIQKTEKIIQLCEKI